MPDPELLQKVEEVRAEVAALELRHAERAHADEAELSTLQQELERLQAAEEAMDKEAQTALVRIGTARAETQRLRAGLATPGLWSRAMAPAVMVTLLLACFLLFGWGKGHGYVSQDAGMLAGFLGAVWWWARQKGPGDAA